MFQRTVFNDEQNYFRESVAKFANKEILPHHSQWEKEGIVPREIWLKAGDLGILCPNIPKEYGGIGGDFGSEEVEAVAVPVVDPLLNCGEVDATECACGFGGVMGLFENRIVLVPNVNAS